MLVGEAPQSGPVGGKVLASKAGQFFACAEDFDIVTSVTGESFTQKGE